MGTRGNHYRKRCYGVSHNDISPKDITHNDTSHKDTSHNVTVLINDPTHNDISHIAKNWRHYS